MNEENEIGKKELEDKTFGRLTGKIIPENLVLEGLDKVSFDFKAKDSVHRFTVDDKRVISKLFSLHGDSFKNSIRDYRQTGKVGRVLIEELQNKIRGLISKVDRNLVILVDKDVKPISIVSEQHQQLPLSRAYEIVDSIAAKRGAKLVTSRDSGRSYVVEYEISQNNDMSVRVSAYLGRNDALGRAGITFVGGGHIFVCSNMIVPHIDRDIHYKGNELLNVKIVHTTNIEKNLTARLEKSFDAAKQNAGVLVKAFAASKKIEMSRVLQRHCVELIREKINLPNKWNSAILNQLLRETETLYGLSQALTWVGTHLAGVDSEISRTLQKMGGQVVLLGKDFVKLITRSLQKRGVEVPKLVTN